MTSDNLVFLAFNNPNVPVGERDLLTCGVCSNKTFTARADLGDFPVAYCAACGIEIGKFGWAE